MRASFFCSFNFSLKAATSNFVLCKARMTPCSVEATPDGPAGMSPSTDPRGDREPRDEAGEFAERLRSDPNANVVARRQCC